MENEKTKCPWYVLYTRPKFEKIASRELWEMGIETFLPVQQVTRQWSDRRKKIEVPVFPNYVFINIPVADRHKVFDVKGIVKYISYGGTPATLLQSEIESIKRMLHGNPEVSVESFYEGDLLRVNSGPMIGLNGVLVEKKGKSKLAIRLEAMNRYLLVEICPSQLERTEACIDA